MLHFIDALVPLLWPLFVATKDSHQSGTEIKILLELELSCQLKSKKKKSGSFVVLKHVKGVTLFSASAGWGLVQEDACTHARFSSAAHGVTEAFIPVSGERNTGFQTQYV